MTDRSREAICEALRERFGEVISEYGIRDIASLALTAYESHLQASGMAVVPVVEAPSGDDEFMAWLLTPAWQPIETMPETEDVPFLVLLPKNDIAPFVILQVTRFEGRLYPDARNACIDWEDGITTATHWMYAHFGKSERPPASAEAQSAVAHTPDGKALMTEKKQ